MKRPRLLVSTPIAPLLSVKTSWRPLLLGLQLHIRILSGWRALTQVLCPFWPENFQFSEFCFSYPCCNTLSLIGDAAFTSLFYINLPIEGTLKTVTEFVHGVNSVVDSCSLPSPPAERLWSESPWAWVPGPPDHLTGEDTNSLGFFPCFGYFPNPALRHALSVVLLEIPQPTYGVKFLHRGR